MANTERSFLITDRLLYAMDIYVAKTKSIGSVDELCNLVGIQASAVSRWRSRGAAATSDNIAALCQACGIQPNYVILERGEMFFDSLQPLNGKRVTRRSKPVKKKIRVRR